MQWMLLGAVVAVAVEDVGFGVVAAAAVERERGESGCGK